MGGTSTPHPFQPFLSTVWEFIPAPEFDFNEDGIVDAQDVALMIDHWHTDAARYDLAPSPAGDGIVDVQDLVALSEHLFEDDRLLALWLLDETEGMFAYDSAAENDALVIGNPVWQPDGGQVEGALQFDGIDDYIAAPLTLNPAEDTFSVFAWIKGGRPGQTLISQQGGFGAWLSVDLAGALVTSFTFPLPAVTSNVVVTDGQWHHIGLASDGSGLSLYVDDVEVARSDLSPVLPANGDIHIGVGNSLEPGTFWSGMIDDVRIYNQAITP